MQTMVMKLQAKMKAALVFEKWEKDLRLTYIWSFNDVNINGKFSKY